MNLHTPSPPSVTLEENVLLEALLQNSIPPFNSNSQPLHGSADSEDTQNQKLQITFEYYKQQRDEFMSLAQERASLTLQFLIIVGTLVAAFLQTNVIFVRLGIAATIIALGVVGLSMLSGIYRGIRLHVMRARYARDSIGFLRDIAYEPLRHNHYNRSLQQYEARSDGFAWVSIYGGIIIVGLALLSITIW